MGRARGPTLAERSLARQERGGAVPRHCWVRDERYDRKMPGLLLRWDRIGSTWQALVVYALPDRDGLVQGWISGDDLTPA